MSEGKQSRVIDGEAVVKEEKASVDKKPTGEAKGAGKGGRKAAAGQKKSGRADWLARLLALVALAGAGWLGVHMKQLDALVEGQNQLNARLQALEEKVSQPVAEVASLAQRQQTLEKALAALQETVEALSTEVDALNEKVLNPANEPVVTKGEIELLKKRLEGLQGQLQQFAQRWQEALKGLAQPSEGGAKGDEQAPPALKGLEKQLQQMGQQLSQLFGQLAATPEQGQARAEGQIDPLTLQQWLLKVNAEWLLTGDVAQTRERLHALEKAVQLSELPAESKIALLRAIGQDLAYLENYEKQAAVPQQALTALRGWIRELEPPAPGEAAHADDQVHTDLMARLKGLVEIRRRDEGLSEPERLMAFDLVRQRALVLVDQLAWAYASHNAALFARTKAHLIKLFRQALPGRLDALKQRLEALPEPVRPHPLKSAEAR